MRSKRTSKSRITTSNSTYLSITLPQFSYMHVTHDDTCEEHVDDTCEEHVDDTCEEHVDDTCEEHVDDTCEEHVDDTYM